MKQVVDPTGFEAVCINVGYNFTSGVRLLYYDQKNIMTYFESQVSNDFMLSVINFMVEQNKIN